MGFRQIIMDNFHRGGKHNSRINSANGREIVKLNTLKKRGTMTVINEYGLLEHRATKETCKMEIHERYY